MHEWVLHLDGILPTHTRNTFFWTSERAWRGKEKCEWLVRGASVLLLRIGSTQEALEKNTPPLFLFAHWDLCVGIR
jgi:hypothetical protein